MGASSSGTETVTQRSEPWAASQPYLRDIFGQAQGLYNQGAEYYPGSTVVPFHGDTLQGMDALRQRFQGSPVGYDQAAGALTSAAGAGQLAPDLINQSTGANPFISGIQTAANRQNDAGADVLQQFAGGQNNPYLDATFNRAAEQVRDGTNAMFSKAGRYGSTANQDALSGSLGDLATQIYGGAYESDAARRFGAAEALGARQAGDINRGLAGQQMAAGLAEGQFGRQFGAGQAFNQQGLQASALLPMLDQYGQSGARGLMELGGIRENMAGMELQDMMDRWNFMQNAGWDQLGRYNSVVQPLASLGGTQTGTQPAQSRTGRGLQGGLGGALAGSAFGMPWLGAGLGALGGLFG